MMTSLLDHAIRVNLENCGIVALLLGLLRIFPRTQPAVQVWLWRAALARMLLGGIWSISVTKPTWLNFGALETSRLPVATVSALPSLGIGLDQASAPIAVFVVGAWILCAVLIVAFRTRLALATHLTLLRGSREAPEWLRDHASRIASAIGLGVTPRVLVSDETSTPLVAGVIRPKVLVPASLWSDHSDDTIGMVLAHEFAHIRRRDLIWSVLPWIVQNIFFFNPAIWIACRQNRLAQELACDQEALRVTGARPAALAALLVSLLERPKSLAPRRALVLGVLGEVALVQRRIKDMASFRSMSRHHRLLSVSMLVVASAIATLTFANASSDLKWHTDESAAFKLAGETGRLVYVEGWADWCESCKKMDAETFKDETVRKELADHWVLLRLDLSKSFDPGKKFGISALPSSQITRSEKKFGYRVKLEGYLSAQVLLRQLAAYRTLQVE